MAKFNKTMQEGKNQLTLENKLNVPAMYSQYPDVWQRILDTLCKLGELPGKYSPLQPSFANISIVQCCTSMITESMA